MTRMPLRPDYSGQRLAAAKENCPPLGVRYIIVVVLKESGIVSAIYYCDVRFIERIKENENREVLINFSVP